MYNDDDHGHEPSIWGRLSSPPRDVSIRICFTTVGNRDCLHAFEGMSCTRPATWSVAVALYGKARSERTSVCMMARLKRIEGSVAPSGFDSLTLIFRWWQV